MRRLSSFCLVACLVALAAFGAAAGCSSSDDGSKKGRGGSGGGGSGGGGGGGPAPRFTLTSAAFVEDAAFPAEHTCAGADTSPPLEWTNAPVGTASFAILLTDYEPTIPVSQWAIWDIPASTTSLPAGLGEDEVNLTTPPGAKQQSIARNGSPGYMGPCPGGAEHTFFFRLLALNVATLPNVSETSTVIDVRDEILDHLIDFTDLYGESNASVAP